jgi:hypothetical protein
MTIFENIAMTSASLSDVLSQGWRGTGENLWDDLMAEITMAWTPLIPS